ncbi:MAG: hypothetical protein LBM77_10235 [Spirochaetaceae bacterium]|jgi:hypothetical protein|nr:hypothetical protein [Spirochaetaceae bacterium]
MSRKNIYFIVLLIIILSIVFCAIACSPLLIPPKPVKESPDNGAGVGVGTVEELFPVTILLNSENENKRPSRTVLPSSNSPVYSRFRLIIDTDPAPGDNSHVHDISNISAEQMETSGVTIPLGIGNYTIYLQGWTSYDPDGEGGEAPLEVLTASGSSPFTVEHANVLNCTITLNLIDPNEWDNEGLQGFFDYSIFIPQNSTGQILLDGPHSLAGLFTDEAINLDPIPLAGGQTTAATVALQAGVYNFLVQVTTNGNVLSPVVETLYIYPGLVTEYTKIITETSSIPQIVLRGDILIDNPDNTTVSSIRAHFYYDAGMTEETGFCAATNISYDTSGHKITANWILSIAQEMYDSITGDAKYLYYKLEVGSLGGDWTFRNNTGTFGPMGEFGHIQQLTADISTLERSILYDITGGTALLVDTADGDNNTNLLQDALTKLQALGTANGGNLSGKKYEFHLDANYTLEPVTLGSGIYSAICGGAEVLELYFAGSGTISLNAASKGSLFTLTGQKNLRVYLKDFVILQGHANNTAPLVMVGQSNTFNLMGMAEITGNTNAPVGTTGNGGGIYLEWYAKLNMTGGSIHHNSATGNGGGIYTIGWPDAIDISPIINLSGGSILQNTANGNGAGIYLNQGARLVMTGGRIGNNKAAGLGGGVYLDMPELNSVQEYANNNRMFRMNGGTIQANSASNGGGVYVNSHNGYGILNGLYMRGGAICGNGIIENSDYNEDGTLANAPYVSDKYNNVGGNLVSGTSLLSVFSAIWPGVETWVQEGNRQDPKSYGFYFAGNGLQNSTDRYAAGITIVEGMCPIPISGNSVWASSNRDELPSFTVTWKNNAGTAVLATDTVTWGTMPIFTGTPNPPVRDPDDNYLYTFEGFASTPNQEVGMNILNYQPVTADVTYYAAFSKFNRYYWVHWYNQEGTVIIQDDPRVEYSSHPSYLDNSGGTPPSKADADYIYTFQGWAEEPGQSLGVNENQLPVVDTNMNYYATFTAEPSHYAITWRNWDGSLLLDDGAWPINTPVVYNGPTPTMPSQGNTTYFFDGWASSSGGLGEKITLPPELWEDVTYYAHFVAGQTILFDTTDNPGGLPVSIAEANGANMLEKSINKLNDLGRATGGLATKSYEIRLDTNYSITSKTFGTGTLSSIKGTSLNPLRLSIVSTDAVRTISLTGGSGSLFNLAANAYIELSILGQTQLIGAAANNTTGIVTVNTGNVFSAKDDTQIKNNHTINGGGNRSGGVSVTGGTFNLENRAKITGNVIAGQGGAAVRIQSDGEFFMRGESEITGNSTSTDFGVVFVEDGTFTMEGGKIYANNGLNNTSTGGVYVKVGGIFRFENGDIYNNDLNIKEASASLAIWPTGTIGYVGASSVTNIASATMVTDATTDALLSIASRGESSSYFARYATAPVWTITWKNYNNTTIGSIYVIHGNLPIYSGSAPTMAMTAEFTFTWTGWARTSNSQTPLAEIPRATQNATYYAAYTLTRRTYQVLWKNHNGSLTLETDAAVPYGTRPEYNGAEPTRTANDYTYSFVGWSASQNATSGTNAAALSTITGAVTYYAAFSWIMISGGNAALSGTNTNLSRLYYVKNTVDNTLDQVIVVRAPDSWDNPGTGTITFNDRPATMEVLIVGGGGNGGDSWNRFVVFWAEIVYGGGGGAGGLYYNASVAPGQNTYTVSVGRGGYETDDGEPSSVSNIATVLGGGHGGTGAFADDVGKGGDGGSGGGGGKVVEDVAIVGFGWNRTPGGKGTEGQGHDGGNGGGGGGAGGKGTEARSGMEITNTAWAGGPGRTLTIEGSRKEYARGGIGTSGIANKGSSYGIPGEEGTGNGGGAAYVEAIGWTNKMGAHGGSGIVVFRYRYNQENPPRGATVVTETYTRQ